MVSKVCELKAKFGSSCIYKKTLKNPKLYLGWSKTKLKDFTDWAIKNNWGRWHHQNFILISAEKINRLYETQIRHHVKIQTKDDIYLELLKNRLRQKDFDDRKKADFNYSANSRKTKSAINYLKKSGRPFPDGEDKIKIDAGISLKTIAATFGVSVATTHGILKRLFKSGLIAIKKRFTNFGRLDQQSFLALQSLYNGVFKNKYNIIMKLDTSIISIINKEKKEGVENGTLVCN